ncbi:hypothetical protein ACFLY6_00340 [Candidatus Dependentiae bacterium]
MNKKFLIFSTLLFLFTLQIKSTPGSEDCVEGIFGGHGAKVYSLAVILGTAPFFVEKFMEIKNKKLLKAFKIAGSTLAVTGSVGLLAMFLGRKLQKISSTSNFITPTSQ